MLPDHFPIEGSTARMKIAFGDLVTPCKYSFRDLLAAALPQNDVNAEHEKLMAMTRTARNDRVKQLCCECGWHSRSIIGSDGLEYEAFSPDAAMSMIRQEHQRGERKDNEIEQLTRRFTALGFTTKRQFGLAEEGFANAMDALLKVAQVQMRALKLMRQLNDGAESSKEVNK